MRRTGEETREARRVDPFSILSLSLSLLQIWIRHSGNVLSHPLLPLLSSLSSRIDRNKSANRIFIRNSLPVTIKRAHLNLEAVQAHIFTRIYTNSWREEEEEEKRSTEDAALRNEEKQEKRELGNAWKRGAAAAGSIGKVSGGGEETENGGTDRRRK